MSGRAAARDLVRHMEWADAEVWAVVSTLHESARGDPRLRDLLHHAHLTQHAFLALWRHEEIDYRAAMEPKDLASLQAWGREGSTGIARFVSEADEPGLSLPLAIPWSERLREKWGQVGEVTLLESMLQVAMHSAYHRGQVNARIRELGETPPLTDYIAWIWKNRPTPRW